MLKAGVINLSPDYQREAVVCSLSLPRNLPARADKLRVVPSPLSLPMARQWPETHSAGLIESLLRNMHVPELLFNIYTPVPSDKRYKLVHPDAQIDPENKARLPAGWKGESDSDGESELEEDVDAKGRAKGKKVPRKV